MKTEQEQTNNLASQDSEQPINDQVTQLDQAQSNEETTNQEDHSSNDEVAKLKDQLLQKELREQTIVKLLDSDLPRELVDVINCTNAEINKTSYDTIIEVFNKCVDKTSSSKENKNIFVSTGIQHGSMSSHYHDDFSSGLR